MKKILVKAVALSLVMGGVGFVANNAQAFSPIEEIQLKSKVDANHVRSMSNQDAITNIRGDVATNKANIQTNAKGISDNNIAIQKEAAARKGDIAMTNFKAGLEKQERENADKKLSGRIDANKTAIEAEAAARKGDIAFTNFKAGLEKQERENNDKKLDAKIDKEATTRENADKILNLKVNAEGQARVENDKILNNKIDKETKDRETADKILNLKVNAEGQARVENDKILNAKIDSNAAKVQEQLDAQVNKNNAQDASIKANGAAIKVNKDAIKANADAIKANKDAADATNTYFNGRIENNTANIDKNKVAIENEAKDRKAADQKLQNNINAEATTRENAVNALNSRIDQLGSDATKGIAKASALAALHPLDYDPDNKFDIAAAGGFYKGENAFALGAFYRPNRNVMLSMGTTLTSGDNAYNVGLTFKIGKSGKHTETGLTTADLYAMIGAMQDKMDQQQKKIEELEAKQAK